VFDFEAGAAEAAAAATGTAAADAVLAAKAAAAWGEEEEEDAEQGTEGRPQNGAADAAASSDSEGEAPAAAAWARRQPGGRVLHTHAQANSPLVRLLRSCARAGDWASLVAHLRQLSPVAVDSEIRGMQVLEGAPQQEVEDLGLLLQFLEEETASNRNFEFMQASRN
jgi:hypothetical protein